MLSQQKQPPASGHIQQLARTLHFIACAYICALPTEVERAAVRAWLQLALGRIASKRPRRGRRK